MHFLEKQKVKLGIENSKSKINIKGFAKKTKVRYKTTKTVLQKIINLDKIKKDWRYSRIKCRALNEGITELLKQKAVDGHKTYHKEVNVVKQIENIIGIESIIDVTNKHPERMKDLLNMDSNEYDLFCSQLDYIAFLDELKNKIEESFYAEQKYEKLTEFNENEGKYLNDELLLTTVDVQVKLVQKLFIPYFESNKEINDELFDKAMQCSQLMELYCNQASLYGNGMGLMEKTEEYKKIRRLFDYIVVQYATENIEKIDTWDREKILAVDKKLFKYGFIRSDNFGDEFDTYIDFTEKLYSKIEEIKSNEDKKILDEVKQKIEGKEKIDINFFIKNFDNEYTSYDINDKVEELILNRKLTPAQKSDLTQEVLVYCDCGKVLSRKDIKKAKNESGVTEYYVIVNGEKLTYDYLKKIKLGRKFLSSKKFEFVENEKEEPSKKMETLLSVSDEGSKGRIERFIAKIKKIFARKESEVASGKNKIPEADFKEGLRVDIDKTAFNVQGQQQKHTKTINIDEKERE